MSAFGRDSKYPDSRSDGQAALFAFTLDAEGHLVENSATLSACSWAISRMESPGPSKAHWLDGFKDEEREFTLGLNKLVPPKARNTHNTSTTALANGTLSTAAKVVGEQAKSAAIDAVTAGAKATGMAVTAATATAVGSVAGPSSAGSPAPWPGCSPRNCRPRKQAVTRRPSHEPTRRARARTSWEAVVKGVAPQRMPGGRWPTDTRKPLVLSQQFAVNQIQDELARAVGVFAVNGPPGTGKTTMLRDVLAAVVVDRAQQLADLRNPVDAFTGELEQVVLGKTYTVTVRGLRPEVTGFEVVVATASNGAAENVTAEIPGINAVRGQETEALAVDYFAALASHVLGDEAWGLIAAKLGKQKNRIDFAKRFWWGG